MRSTVKEYDYSFEFWYKGRRILEVMDTHGVEVWDNVNKHVVEVTSIYIHGAFQEAIPYVIALEAQLDAL